MSALFRLYLRLSPVGTVHRERWKALKLRDLVCSELVRGDRPIKACKAELALIEADIADIENDLKRRGAL